MHSSDPTQSNHRPWANSVVYQIYPKSFCDTTGSGTGDLQGIISKLPYLQNLGVDYLWITPFYPSPQNDNGYDVADYYGIDPSYGSMDDFEELVREARIHGMEIMLDMVFNHTSTEHEWFQKALAGDKTYQDYYIFKDPVNGHEPTNWQSKFGGNAWEFVPHLNKYYLHLFDATQADLNWDNPEVREEIYKVVNFWLEKGVRGLRLDVINLISKPDVFIDDLEGDGRRFYTDGPRIHQYLKELNQKTFGQYPDVITVGEMSSTSLEYCIDYSNPDEKELSMTFNFHHLKVDYPDGEKWKLANPDFTGLKQLFNKWQKGMAEAGGWNALFWCNHDQPRIVSRLGDDQENRELSAKMLATMIHFMHGTPYIYQGEELGMTNAHFKTLSQYRDVESLNHYQKLQDAGLNANEVLDILAARSRDNARTPVQWNASAHAGFTTGTPWIEVNENYREINVEKAVQNSGSVFHYYRRLISLRKEHEVISTGEFTLLEESNPDMIAYTRKTETALLTVFCNLTAKPLTTATPLTEEQYTLISNYDEPQMQSPLVQLRPWEARVYLKPLSTPQAR